MLEMLSGTIQPCPCVTFPCHFHEQSEIVKCPGTDSRGWVSGPGKRWELLFKTADVSTMHLGKSWGSAAQPWVRVTSTEVNTWKLREARKANRRTHMCRIKLLTEEALWGWLTMLLTSTLSSAILEHKGTRPAVHDQRKQV